MTRVLPLHHGRERGVNHREVLRRTSHICHVTPERNVTIRTYQILAAVLYAESAQGLATVIDKRRLGVFRRQVSHRQKTRESVLECEQAILVPRGNRTAEQ